MTNFEVLRDIVAKMDPVNGFKASGLLFLPRPIRSCFNQMMRSGNNTVTLETWAGMLELPEAQAKQIGTLLVEKGYLGADDEHSSFTLSLARTAPTVRSKRANSLFDALED
jgi:DNA-binding IclR family transcriptional regulator